MKYVLTSKEMKDCDTKAIEEFGIASLVLMERAAWQTAQIIMERFGTDICVGVIAGTGNNGGDGVAIARILREYGVHTELHLIGDERKCTQETRRQLETAIKLGIAVSYGASEHYVYDVIVDALFGIGLTRVVEGRYKTAIEAMNASKAKVVAVDIPSGVSADDGTIMGSAVQADITVTYQYRKLGQLLYPGALMTGELICVPIGIPEETLDTRQIGIATYTRDDFYMPLRRPDGNKGTFGKVLLVAGSRTMGGACQLSALSAFRIGAGMVKVFTADVNRDSLLKKVPEAMIATYTDDGRCGLKEEELAELRTSMEWADVVVIGPGLSVSPKAKSILEVVIYENKVPLVMDADALNLLAQDEKLLSFFEYANAASAYETVITPHMAEFARLIKHPVSEIKKDVLGYCRSFTNKYNMTLVCKDARTFVCKRHKKIYLNTSGNDGMATAGSGDVLTGIIAGIMAQGTDCFEAAVTGTYAHGLAGDIAKEQSSSYYLMAQDIIQALRMI